jgi:beta-mannosidase
VRTVFTDASGVRYRSIRLLSSVKEAQLPRPKLSVFVVPAGDGLDVTVSADVFAKGVFLHIPGAMLRLDASGKPLPGTCTALNFSDNYFDLTAGESRTVHVSSPLPPDEFRSRLVVTSI